MRELHSKGITFGSHTVTHPQLSDLSSVEVEHEIKLSKEIIEDKLGEGIDTFSYPFKFPEADKAFTKLLRDLLQKHGYHYDVSTRIGTTSKSDDMHFMKRIPANSRDDMAFFQAKLEGGYDWLYKLQRIVKKIRSTKKS